MTGEGSSQQECKSGESDVVCEGGGEEREWERERWSKRSPSVAMLTLQGCCGSLGRQWWALAPWLLCCVSYVRVHTPLI